MHARCHGHSAANALAAHTLRKTCCCAGLLPHNRSSTHRCVRAAVGAVLQTHLPHTHCDRYVAAQAYCCTTAAAPTDGCALLWAQCCKRTCPALCDRYVAAQVNCHTTAATPIDSCALPWAQCCKRTCPTHTATDMLQHRILLTCCHAATGTLLPTCCCRFGLCCRHTTSSVMNTLCCAIAKCCGC